MALRYVGPRIPEPGRRARRIGLLIAVALALPSLGLAAASAISDATSPHDEMYGFGFGIAEVLLVQAIFGFFVALVGCSLLNDASRRGGWAVATVGYLIETIPLLAVIAFGVAAA